MLIFVIPLYVLLQVVVLYQMRGLWRAAAAVPLLGVLPFLAMAVHAYSQQSEIWLLPLILACPVAIVALAILWGLFHWTTRRTGQPS
jgi:hypothetical protein